MKNAEQLRFEQLYQEHHRMVRNVLFNMVDRNHLDDLVQEAFVKIWKGLPRFSFLSSEKTWIYRITIHTAIDFLRKPQLDLALAAETLKLKNFQSSLDPSAQVQAALQQLDEKHRSVLVLFYFEDLELRQISRILEIPVGTVKSRLSVGREQLKGLLGPQEGVHEALEQKVR